MVVPFTTNIIIPLFTTIMAIHTFIIPSFKVITTTKIPNLTFIKEVLNIQITSTTINIIEVDLLVTSS